MKCTMCSKPMMSIGCGPRGIYASKPPLWQETYVCIKCRRYGDVMHTFDQFGLSGVDKLPKGFTLKGYEKQTQETIDEHM